MYAALSQNNCSSAMQPFSHRASVTAVSFSLLPVGGITLPPMGQGFVNVPSITRVVAVQRPLFNREADGMRGDPQIRRANEQGCHVTLVLLDTPCLVTVR